jgi:ATP/maltotriose-dependent transcriptional regulator MalT
LDHLDVEYDNLRAALAWCGRPDGDDERYHLGARLSASLGWFWYLRGDFREGRAWLERFANLSRPNLAARASRGHTLSAAGWLALFVSDADGAHMLLDECLSVSREIGDWTTISLALSRLAWAAWGSMDYEQALALAAESESISRERGDRWGTAFALNIQGKVLRTHGRVDGALRLYGESRAIFQEIGDRWGAIQSLTGLGQLALYQGDLARAEGFWEEQLVHASELGGRQAIAHVEDLLGSVARRRGNYSRAAERFSRALALRQEVGDRGAQAWTLHEMGELALAQRDADSARARFLDSLRLHRETHALGGICASLEAFSRLATLQGQYRRAVRFAAASLALRGAIGPSLTTQHFSQGVLVVDPAPYQSLLETIRGRLSRADYDTAWSDGWTAPLDDAIAEALRDDGEMSLRSTISKATSHLDALTPREREVAALVARGLTNRQVASELVISEGTCHLHVVHVLSKLGFHSRTQLAAWAAERGIFAHDVP